MKKLLALVLALVMTLGLATVSSNAAFADADQIEHKEAVEVLNSLGVINGKENNNYDPTANVKRSEMAKMVTILMLGDVDVSAFTGAPTDLTDINGHWAEGYIKFCVAQGIVGGRGNGKFDPDANVTATEAAKMLLTAIGYNANIQGYGGDQWKVNVARDAQLSGFYEELKNLSADKALTRDETAQMVYNAGGAQMIQKTSSVSRGDGSIRDEYAPYDEIAYPDKNLIHETFDGLIRVGYLSNMTYDSNKKTWTYTFSNASTFGGNAYTGTDRFVAATAIDSKIDYTGLYGQKVKVVYDYKDEETFGVFAKDSKVLATALPGQISDIDATKNTVKVSGETIKVDAATIAADGLAWYQDGVGGYTAVTTAGGNAAPTTAAGNLTALSNWSRAFTAKLIDNKDDGKVDTIIVIPHTVAQVTWVGTDTVIVNNGIGTLDLEDCYFAYGTPAKEDYVLYTNPAVSPIGAFTFEKLELQTGTVDATKTNAADATNSYQLDGAWYGSGAASVNGSKNASYVAGGGLLIPGGNVNDTFEYVAYGSKLFYNKVTDIAATTKQIAMVISCNSSGAATNLGVDVAKAKLLLADGTKPTVQVAKITGTGVTTVEYKASTDNAATVTTEVAKCIGKLVTYKVNGDGNYELTTVSAANTAGYKTYNAVTEAYNNKKIGKADLAKDTIVYVLGGAEGTANAANDGKIYSGAELINTYGSGVWGDDGYALTDTVNGFTYARVAVLSENSGLPTITGASNYAYLTGATTRTIENGDTYLNYTMWTANGSLTAKEKNTDATGLYPKGAIITYDTTSTDGVIKNVNVVNAVGGIVTGWKTGATTGDIQISGLGTKKVDADDTTVLFIDSHNYKGYESGTIMLAEDKDSDGTPDWPNVRYISGASNLNLLVVDVNQDMSGTLAGSSADVDAVEAELASFTTVTVAGNWALDKNITIPAGKTLIVTGTFDEDGHTIQRETTDTTSKLTVGAFVADAIDAVQVSNIEITGDQALDATTLHANVKSLKIAGKFTTTGNVTGGSTTGVSIEVGSLGTSAEAITTLGTNLKPDTTSDNTLTVKGSLSLEDDCAVLANIDIMVVEGTTTVKSGEWLTGASTTLTVNAVGDAVTLAGLATKSVTLNKGYAAGDAALTLGKASTTTEFIVPQYQTLSSTHAGGITLDTNITLTVEGKAIASGAAGFVNTNGKLSIATSGSVEAAALSDWTSTHAASTGTGALLLTEDETISAADASGIAIIVKSGVTLTTSGSVTLDKITGQSATSKVTTGSGTTTVTADTFFSNTGVSLNTTATASKTYEWKTAGAMTAPGWVATTA